MKAWLELNLELIKSWNISLLNRVCVSHSEIVEAESVRLVFEDVITKSSQYTQQQQWHQDGRHSATRVGVALGRSTIGYLEKTDMTNTHITSVTKYIGKPYIFFFNNACFSHTHARTPHTHTHTHGTATLCCTGVMETWLSVANLYDYF